MEDFTECSNKLSNKAASEKRPEAYVFSPARPELPRQLFASMGYVEDFLEPRTKLGTCLSILVSGRRFVPDHSRRRRS